MPRFSVNIDHIATVREARKTIEPDVVQAGLLVEKAGADGVTVHLRADRRHIQEGDVRNLKNALRIMLNLEMAATGNMLQAAKEIKPHLVTLVPEKDEELTTEGGLDVVNAGESLVSFIKSLKEMAIPVSIFVNPEETQIKASVEAGADTVEIHTGVYAEKFLEGKDVPAEFERIERAVKTARDAGLKVNAGHGLTYQNVSSIVKIRGIEEMSIGHSVISRALFIGLESAVREMKKLVAGGD